jgi:hypothetical protein
MKLIIKTNKLLFFSIFSFGLLISFFSFFILPEKFFHDTKIIVIDKYNEIGYFGSYPLTILFYKISFLKHLPFPITAIIQYSILIYILYKIGVPEKFHKITVKNILVYLSFFMLAIFVSMPSKEFITFTYLSLIAFTFLSTKQTNKQKTILVVVLLSLFAIFRPYFLLIPIVSLGMYLLSYVKFRMKTISTIFYGIIIVLFLSFSNGVIKGKYLSETNREALNKERKNDKDANSIIVSPIPTNTWYGETVGIFNGFFAVNIPLIEGIKHMFSPQIIAFIVWQLLLLYILVIRFSRYLKDRNKYFLELCLILIVFSYFILQGLFEPDLGSAIRHKIGVFPLIYLSLYYEDFRKKI